MLVQIIKTYNHNPVDPNHSTLICEGVTCCHQGHENFHDNAVVVSDLVNVPRIVSEIILVSCQAGVLHIP